ncbi:MAG: carboxypeptidase M32, partial [Candidatus Hodarchaeales archaeon]
RVSSSLTTNLKKYYKELSTMATIKETYNNLLKTIEELVLLTTVRSVLGWDFETHMPPKAVELRSKQFSYLASLMHSKMTDPKIGELLKEVKDHKDYTTLNEVEKRNIYLIEREYKKQTKVPRELVAEIASQSAKTVQIWKKAKEEKNYELYKPELGKILELTEKKAHYLDPEKDPFDVLLDDFEPGMTSEQITILFEELKKGLIPIIEKCVNAQNQPETSFLKRSVPVDVQKELSKDLAKIIHYDLERGSIDETEHPFTTGYYDDVRITTHYYENDFINSFYSVMHEGGHALYEQNLNRDYMFQPVGAHCSLGFHESQSRFIENIIGRSPEFWEFFLPRFKEITGDIFKDIDVDSMVKAVNEIRPSKIRVTADEVTYSLHVIIRFEIERELLKGNISLDELPKVWNQKYKEYLGVDIENDSEGVMQDTHWAGGAFGYFPTYALGNIYNAHLLAFMKKDIPNFNDLVREGNLKPIIDWLIEKVHKPSNLYDPPELIKRITGEEINPKYFIEYIQEKYSKIYGI